MGQLDEQKFEEAVAGCTKCDYKAFEVSAYLDRRVHVMLAKSMNDGRWMYDEEKFFDGVFRVECLGCKTRAFDSADCPRCHRAGALADALERSSRLVVPTRCPECKGTELALSAFAPATVKTGAHQRAAPTPSALFGEVGYQVAQIECEICEWTKVAEGCPLCGGPGPLRARP